jgi:uncharacterized YccA/Bax inhibitor family protein
VLTRLDEVAARERSAGRGPLAPAGYRSPVQPVTTEVDVRPMTIDDVVVRTVALLALTGIAGAVAWAVVPERYTFAGWITAALAGLVLGLAISFARITNPALIGAYAVVEGVLVGLVSRYYEGIYSGIVVQAAVGTFGVFFLMAMLYRARVIRATPKFVRGVLAALLGAVVIMLLNFGLALFNVHTPLRDGSPIAILFSLAMIVIAALTFILDFDQVEQGVRYGLPQRYAWLCAFGILVGLIWLYLEVIRLLGYLRR